ncbi:PP2C family protein-serine/threonine phosphatase [Bremerella sp. T1]|uniref:PP2C family protein-serine/threonine phosphatase n=1 Tax=Bremerella sp. TYQ1 TaxID=3119568 RepID=UPI001CC940A0|nr:PP2C family protein-serine/threonine phosphatase [Bremerella volcania]UBM34742.1 PP2C family protein-serine/threonine phosphatase [Bremerella volcania]
MAFTFVLGLAALFQVVAVLLALRLNTIYRRRYAWLFISGAGILMTLWIGAGLFETIQDPPGQVVWEPTLWVQTLATLLTAILFFSGIATIEPLFKENEAARALLATENAMLNREVQHSREEMQLAQRVQANLLPKHAPDFPGLDIAFLSRPAEWTSGDYFDFVQIDEDTLIVTVADVCGHGLGPALLMTTSRSYFRGIARTRKECQPIVNTWNHAIAEDIEAGDFMTALVVRLDLAQKRIEYLGAGQNGLLIQPDGSHEELERSGPPLGVLDDFQYPGPQALPLESGQILVLCTDGIHETMGHDETQFGTQRIADLISQHRDRNAAELVEKLAAEVRSFAADPRPQDDLTAVVIKIK